MKKLTGAVPAAAIFFVLAVLLVFMCLPLGQKTVGAVDGVLDLRGQAMDKSVFTLDGRWEFYHEQLLTPEEIAGQTPATIEVPSCWTEEGYPLDGYATYRLVIMTDSDEPLMLHLPEIYTAYALWVNGELIHTAGVLSEQAEGSRGLFENALLPVAPEDGVIDIVIEVSSFGYAYGGLPCSLLIGESGPLLSSFFRTRGLYILALGGVLMAAFYHFALYTFRRREKIYLFFSLLCMMCFFKFMLEKNGLVELLHLIPFDMFGSRVYVVLFLLHSVSVMLFALDIFNHEFLYHRRFAVVAYLLFMTLLFLFMPMNKLYNVIAVAALSPAIILTVIMAVRSGRLFESTWTKLYFAAFVFYLLVAGAAKLFLEDFMFMTGLLPDMFMIMVQSLVLSRNYAAAFELVEDTNANLERIVDNRTEDLRNTNNAMRELVGNISHDLKTPLTGMSVNLEKLLSITPGDEKYARYIQIAYNKNLDLQRLIQNLIEVSRIEAGQGLYRPEWVSLNGLLADVQEKYGEYLESEGLSLDVSSGIDDVSVYADPVKIWSVFDNLIYNAVRHTETGSITVTAEAEGNTVKITVSDTGCGIAPEHLPRIFERFYKAGSDRGAREGDSGVGLYIVRSVMEGFGGSVAVQSEIGKGTSFILTFAKQE